MCSDRLLPTAFSSTNKISNSLGADEVMIYTSDAIEHVDTVALTPGGLLLVVLMAGGDYDSGIFDYGVSTTHGLAKCGFGDALLTAAKTLPDDDSFQMFLGTWRAQTRMCLELSTNSHGFLPRRCMALTSKLTSAFPDMEVLDLYLAATTSWTIGLGSHVRDTVAPSWKPHEPVIHEITAFCQQRLGWSEPARLLKRFEKVLWGGVICRMLCSVCKFLHLVKTNYSRCPVV
jgi:Holliday junction resolvase YEN1